MSPAELADLRGRAINGDKDALKQWLALPKAAPQKAEPAKEPELPVEPEQPADAEPEADPEAAKEQKSKKKR